MGSVASYPIEQPRLSRHAKSFCGQQPPNPPKFGIELNLTWDYITRRIAFAQPTLLLRLFCCVAIR